MGAATDPSRRYATLDESDAVVDAGYPRRLQERGTNFDTSLPKSFCRAMGLTEQGQLLDFRRVKGTEPVVITGEAIVIRPLPGGGDSGGQ